MQLIRLFQLIIIQFLIVSTVQQSACKLCGDLQKNILDYGFKNQDTIIKLVIDICKLGGGEDLCTYMVTNFGKQIFNYKLDFLKRTQIYCDFLLKDCDQEFLRFNLTEFKNKVDKKYPKIQFEKNNQDESSKKAKKQFKALVFNDIHIQNDYVFKSKIHCKDPGGCCSDIHGMPEEEENQAGYWGTPNAFCDVPDVLWSETLKFIKENLEKPDFLFMLGDNVGHQFFRQESSALIDATSFIFKEIKKAFPDTVIIPVLGNHECDPVEYMDFSDYDNFVYKNIVSQFLEFVSQQEIDKFKEKGYFKLEYPENNLKIISMNSQILDGFNTFNMDDNRFSWEFIECFGEELYESEKKNQKVILLSHIEVSDYFTIKELNDSFIYLLERFQDTIVTFMSGHTHNDQLRFLRDSQKKVYMANYICPSITTYSCHDPSFRIFEYSDDKLIDFKQYAFDIDLHNAKARTGDFSFEYDLRYSFLEHYGLKSVEKRELENLAKRLLDKEDDASEKYLSGYYCQKHMKNWEDRRDYVLCETLDELDDIYRCLYKETPTGYIENFPALLFRKVFVSQARFEKNQLQKKEESY